MRQDTMINLLDEKRIEEAIARAEQRSSGEIRISVAPLFWGNVRKAAEKAFERLGMTGTELRNGVLFFIVPARHQFVVLGDADIHEKVGQEFWESISAVMSERFHAGDYTEGLVRGIEMAGEQLARHFPCDACRDVNELSDQIDYGGPRREDEPPKPGA